MTVGNNQPLVFVKSSYSNGQGNCVEVAAESDGGRVVRDSKDVQVGTLGVSNGGWGAFVGAVKLGDL
ncbi:DUF397 domain-containing protein [Streptomyces sp. NPDC087425]|uniref:DUF397 domain-containing protein n=1 Tax=Streptomyces sp. NPDC087425 TaxID=3365787 RepID=UPI0037FBF370